VAATVKLSADGNILLKDGRVSCTCCPSPPADCCPYSATGLGVDYSEDDLPDTINLSDGDQILICSRVGGSFVALGGFGGEDIVIQERGEGWEVTVDENRIFGDYTGQCLINAPIDGQTQPTPEITDNFADTYNVEVFGLEDNYLSGVYTVTRRSLCVWSELIDPEDNAPSGLRLNLPSGLPFNWTIESSDASVGKIGFQNTPIGNYGTPTTKATVFA
jgi:hypothetical protein